MSMILLMCYKRDVLQAFEAKMSTEFVSILLTFKFRFMNSAKVQGHGVKVSVLAKQ